jgi:DNA-binding transcriptional ArsR family regulator
VAAGKPISTIDDPRYLKALAHPLRVRILAMLDEDSASPKELAGRFGASLGVVAYHVRTLHELGLIRLVETRQRRGAIEHLYETVDHARFTDQAWGAMKPAAKQRVLGALLSQIGEYVNGSAAIGGFDRADANMSRLALKLDATGWQQLAEAQKRWLAEVDAVEVGVRERSAEEQDLVDVGLVLLFFESLPLSQAGGGGERRRGTGRTRS